MSNMAGGFGLRYRIPFISDSVGDAIRTVCACLTGLAVLAVAMVLQGLTLTTVLLGLMAAIVAGLIVYQVHRSLSRVHAESGEVKRYARDTEEHYVDVLRRIVRSIEARDRYTLGHSDRVAELSERVALQLGLGEERAQRVRRAGELHDIGLLAVPPGILARPARIGADQFESVKQHPALAEDILRPLGSLADTLPAIRAHHERMNGTGYPHGLKGPHIPLEARVLAVADAYDAMTHDRPHRPAISTLAAVRELRRCSPDGYCPQCVEALAQVMGVPVLEKAMAG